MDLYYDCFTVYYANNLYTVKKIYNPGSGINIQYRIVNLLSFPLVILLNGSWIFQSYFQNNINFNSRLVKLLKGKESIFTIRKWIFIPDPGL